MFVAKGVGFVAGVEFQHFGVVCPHVVIFFGYGEKFVGAGISGEKNKGHIKQSVNVVWIFLSLSAVIL